VEQTERPRSHRSTFNFLVSTLKGEALAGYANGQSGQVESLVILSVRLRPRRLSAFVDQEIRPRVIVHSTQADCCAVGSDRAAVSLGRASDLIQSRKAAGYGSPGRIANACSLRGVWVRIPRLPLAALMVKRTSHLASTEAFQVRILVGAIGKDEGGRMKDEWAGERRDVSPPVRSS